VSHWLDSITARSPKLGPFGAALLFWALVELWALNVFDFVLTRYAMWLGFATESNSVMVYFFRSGDVAAAVFKIGIVTLGCLLLWRLRRYRAALFAAVVLAAIFAALVTYELLWISTL